MNLAQFKFGCLLKFFANTVSVLRLHAGHLHDETVDALTEENGFSHARIAETCLDDIHRIFGIELGDRDFVSFFVLAWLHLHGKGGSTDDVDGAFEFFVQRN